jgi:two-component system cell cycle sensor histidine kinase/response regulator CckA
MRYPGMEPWSASSKTDELGRSMNAENRPSNNERGLGATPDALAVLARGLAHDINNLMSVVLGNTSLIRNRLGGSHACAPLLQSIEEAAQRAGTLTREIMALARSDERISDSVNLNSIVYHVLAEEETRLAPGVRIERYIDPDLWKLAGNQRLASEVVIVLAFNALDAIGEKGQISLRTTNVELNEDTIPAGSSLKPGKYVFLSVEDDGVGIAPRELAQIYNAGYTTKTRKRSIGLSGARQIIRKMNGWMTISSTPDIGTVVQVFLPVLETPMTVSVPLTASLPGGLETVLIIDDEQPILEVGREILKRLGYKVLTAKNGREALDICSTHEGEIQIALLDIVMPVMGGAEAYPHLRKARPGMKIIVCTGFEQEDISHVLRDAGTSCLLKPFLPSVLAQEIRKVLDAK